MHNSFIAMSGGILAWYILVHFIIDWLPQSHKEAMEKSKNAKVRARHCGIYTVGFLPLMLLCGLSWWQIFFSANLLFWSHFFIDTYYSTIMWLKYVRRHPAFVGLNDKFSWKLDQQDIFALQGALNAPLGMILLIAVDQITHFLFLIPIAIMSVK